MGATSSENLSIGRFVCVCCDGAVLYTVLTQGGTYSMLSPWHLQNTTVLYLDLYVVVALEILGSGKFINVE